MKIQILNSAKQDLIDGYFFYEKQSEYLGNYFLDSLYSDVDSLLIYVGIHEIHFTYFRSLSIKFPFAIYYKVDENTIKVHAILDCRKRPAWIRKKF
jgi:hypothetical protein